MRVYVSDGINNSDKLVVYVGDWVEDSLSGWYYCMSRQLWMLPGKYGFLKQTRYRECERDESIL